MIRTRGGTGGPHGAGGPPPQGPRMASGPTAAAVALILPAPTPPRQPYYGEYLYLAPRRAKLHHRSSSSIVLGKRVFPISCSNQFFQSGLENLIGKSFSNTNRVGKPRFFQHDSCWESFFQLGFPILIGKADWKR